jgi:hypothetical protein
LSRSTASSACDSRFGARATAGRTGQREGDGRGGGARGIETHLELEQPREEVPAELAQRLLLDLQTGEHVLGGRVSGSRELALDRGRGFGVALVRAYGSRHAPPDVRADSPKTHSSILCYGDSTQFLEVIRCHSGCHFGCHNFIFMNTETDCAYKLQSIYFLKFATTHPLRQFCERPRFLTTPNMLIEKVVTLRRHRQLRFWPFEAFSKSVRRSTTQRLAIGCKSSHTTFVCSTHTCVERQNVGSLRLRRASRDAR